MQLIEYLMEFPCPHVHIVVQVTPAACGYFDRLPVCTQVHVLPQVTPASYLELLTTFIKLLAEKRKDIGLSRQRLEAGLSKLLTTAAQVEVMQVPKAKLLAIADSLRTLTPGVNILLKLTCCVLFV